MNEGKVVLFGKKEELLEKETIGELYERFASEK